MPQTDRLMIIDAHLDLAYNAVLRDRDVTQPAAMQPIRENEIATVGLPDLRSGGVSLVFATIFCQPRTQKHAGYESPEQAFDQASRQIAYYQQLERDELITRSGTGSAATTSVRILLEGAEAVRNPDDLAWFFERGVRLVGLAWQRTRYAGGTGTPDPLTPAGRALVAQLDQLGIVHDASHLAERAFWDLLHATDQLVVASHSNCRSIVGRDPGERHLTDAMIRAIVERGGVVGINFFDRFLLPADQYGKRRATLDDVVAHIKHICDLAGNAEHVGLGTDMDGGLGREQIPREVETAADLTKLVTRLRDAGFAEADVSRIMIHNWLRIVERMPA
jgi:membrane dipeptidase